MKHKLRKFVDRLPSLETINPIEQGSQDDYYEVRMEEFRHKFHRDLPPTTVWGYNRRIPGPLFDVNLGEPIRVKWINNLPERHLLPLDRSIFHDPSIPDVRTVVHLHGAETETESDGYPEAWFTRNFKEVGPFFKKQVSEYLNEQRATTLWYHDHAMGTTRLNVYAGLAGMYILRDQQEKSLNLPSGKYEIPLIISDKTFNRNGSLFYPIQPNNPPENLPNPSVTPFFNGDTIVANGKVWPFLEVEPRKYRVRLLNASNTRGYELYLDSGQSFYQIGSDGGLLQKPIKLTRLTIEPAERVDLIIDFAEYKGQRIILKNDLGPNADPEDETDDIIQFRVTTSLQGKDDSKIPKDLSTITPLTQNNITTIRNLKLMGSEDEYGRPLLLLNDKKWIDPATEKPRLGTTEVWSLINGTNFTHPMHIHLIQFQILDRRPFDLERYNEDGQIVFTGPAVAPPPNERGWKDTVASPGGQITRVIMKFAPHAGNYVWHCHILEHEDHDMMRPFIVIDPKEQERD